MKTIIFTTLFAISMLSTAFADGKQELQKKVDKIQSIIDTSFIDSSTANQANRLLSRAIGVLTGDLSSGSSNISVIWGGKGQSIQAVNKAGDKILPSGWKADDYKASDTIVALTLNGKIFAYNHKCKRLIPQDWKADWYTVNNHFVVLTLNDKIYAFNDEGKRVIPEDWYGENIELQGNRIKFTWKGKVYLFDKEGNNLLD